MTNHENGSALKALGLLMNEAEVDPLRPLQLPWWQMLRPWTRPEEGFPLSVQAEVLARALEAGVGPEGGVSAEVVSAWLAEEWEASSQRVWVVWQRTLDVIPEGRPETQEQAEAVLEQLQVAKSEADYRLEVLALGLARCRESQRERVVLGMLEEGWDLQANELVGGDDPAWPAIRQRLSCWPQLRPLGRAVSSWAFALGVLKAQEVHLPVVFQQRDLQEAMDVVEDHSSIEAHTRLLVVQGVIRGAAGAGWVIGITRWLESALFGPGGEWAAVPSLREPLWQMTGNGLLALERLREERLEAADKAGLTVAELSMSGVFEATLGDPVSIAVAVVVGRVLARILRAYDGHAVLPVKEEREELWLELAQQITYPIWEEAELVHEMRPLVDQWMEELREKVGAITRSINRVVLPPFPCTVSGFECFLDRELVTAAAALLLRHGAALVEGRFLREPREFRAELQAWMECRLAAFDGRELGPAGAGCWRPGYEAGGGGLPGLSKPLDWRVAEVLQPLLLATLGLLYRQFRSAVAEAVGQVKAEEAARAEVERKRWQEERSLLLEAQAAMAAGAEMTEAARDAVWVARHRETDDDGDPLVPIEQAIELKLADLERWLCDGNGTSRQVGDLASMLVGGTSQAELVAQARWVRELLAPPVPVRLRPFLLELGRALQSNGYRLSTAKPVAAERLGVTVEVLEAWVEQQPFSWQQAEALGLLLAEGRVSISQFGGLTETLMAQEQPQPFTPRWLIRQVEELL